MPVRVEAAGDAAVIKLTRKSLEDPTAEAVGGLLLHLAEGPGRHRLTVDLGELPYVTSMWLAQLVALTRPGGHLVLQESDAGGPPCFPTLEAFDRMIDAGLMTIKHVGTDPHAGQKLIDGFRAAGAEQLPARDRNPVRAVRRTPVGGDARCVRRASDRRPALRWRVGRASSGPQRASDPDQCHEHRRPAPRPGQPGAEETIEPDQGYDYTCRRHNPGLAHL